MARKREHIWKNKWLFRREKWRGSLWKQRWLFGKISEEVKLLSHVQFFATPWTVAHQAPLSMGFSRQEYWSELPFPSLGDLPDPGMEPRSPALQASSLSSELPGKPPICCQFHFYECNKNNHRCAQRYMVDNICGHIIQDREKLKTI